MLCEDIPIPWMARIHLDIIRHKAKLRNLFSGNYLGIIFQEKIVSEPDLDWPLESNFHSGEMRLLSTHRKDVEEVFNFHCTVLYCTECVITAITFLKCVCFFF